MTQRSQSHPVAFAAVDLGASSGRVMLGMLTDEGLAIEEMYRFANEPYSDGGRLYWDHKHLFAESVIGLRAAVEKCCAAGVPLSGIGIDSWGVDVALLNEYGNILAPIRHHRGMGDPSECIRNRGLGEAEVYRIAGVPDQAINTSFQLATIGMEQELASVRPLFIPDLWVHMLTGTYGTDLTIASTSQLVDAVSGDWSRQLIQAYGLASVDFPVMHQAGTLAGTTTQSITDQIGSTRPVPVYRVAGHDTASAFAFAVPGAEDSGNVGLISSGTWSLAGLSLEQPVLTPEAREHGYTNERGATGTLLLRNLNGMWVLQECIRQWRLQNARALRFESLMTEAEQAPGQDEVIDMGDQRLLGPGDMVERVRALCAEAGRIVPETDGEIVRAVLDSLAATYKNALQTSEMVTGNRISCVRIVGGGSKNSLLCQLTANALGLPLLAGPAEASSIGNLAVQIVAAGARESISDVYRLIQGDGSQITAYSPTSYTASL